MITNRSTDKEIYAEVMRDIPHVVIYLKRQYHKLIKKRYNVMRKGIFIGDLSVAENIGKPIVVEYTSQQGNKWCGVFSTKVTAYNMLDFKTLCFAYRRSGSNIDVYAWFSSIIVDSNDIVAHYPPHFWKRVAERLNVNLEGIELVSYVLGNSIAHSTEILSDNQLCMTLWCGTGLGETRDGYVYHIKTFLPDNFLSRTQKEKTKYAQEAEEELVKKQRKENPFFRGGNISEGTKELLDKFIDDYKKQVQK